MVASARSSVSGVPLTVDRAAVGEGDRVGHAAGSAVDAIGSDSFLRRVGARIRDRGERPFDSCGRAALEMLRSSAFVSSRILALRSAGMSAPLLSMGVAAPMFDPGAMTATCAAMVMNVPALAARLPPGPTHTITGSGAVEQRSDDLARSVQRAARRVELDHDRGRALAVCLGDAVADVALHDLVDDAAGGHDVDAVARLCE